MVDYIVSLKNIYRLLRINDYPVYSNGVLPRTKFKGLTLVKFWTQFLLERWRNTEHGKVIWRVTGSKNRYHSELCNRKKTFPFYKEYSEEIFSQLTNQELFHQMEVFISFLRTRKYSHENFLKKLKYYLNMAHDQDTVFNKEASGYFLNCLSYYDNNKLPSVIVDAWFLSMLCLHAIAGESMNDYRLTHIRENKIYLPDELIHFSETTNNLRIHDAASMLSHKQELLWASSLSPYDFYGREQELFDLKDLISTNAKLLVAGPEGTGKTELLRQLLFSISNNNPEMQIAAIQYDSSMTESFSSQFIGLKAKSTGKQFTECLGRLNDDSRGNCLLIIDNMNNPEDSDTVQRLSELSCPVLITSVLGSLPGFITYAVNNPDINTASLIFRNNFRKVLSDKEKDLLNHFLENHNLTHPLSLVLLARHAFYRNLSIKDMIKEFVFSGRNIPCPDDQKFSYIFVKIYSEIQKKEPASRLLNIISSLPYRHYTPDDILSFEESLPSSSVKTALDKLVRVGLLEHISNGYSMHPLIASYLRAEFQQ